MTLRDFIRRFDTMDAHWRTDWGFSDIVAEAEQVAELLAPNATQARIRRIALKVARAVAP